MGTPANFGLALRTEVQTNNKAVWWMGGDARTDGAPQQVRLIEICVASAVASVLGLAIKGAGSGSVGGVKFATGTQPENLHSEPSYPTGNLPFYTAFIDAPTAPSTLIKRVCLPAIVGSMVVWEFEEGELILSPDECGLGLFNISGSDSPLLDVSCLYYGT